MIIFEENRIIYKTPFKKRILNKEDIKEIVICEQVSKYGIEVKSYSNIDLIYKPGIVMIGNINYYPDTVFKFLFKPSSSTYITIMYRPELKEYLDYFVPTD